MGDFKDKHGKTRVGVFLQEVAPDLLNMAGNLTGVQMLNKLGEIIGGSSDLNPAQKANALELLQLDIQGEQERTKRHASDMNSDSWLSKNIRPMTLIFLSIFLALLIVLDSAIGDGFDVKEKYISLLETLALAVYSFYFVLRGINKMIVKRKKS